MIVWLAMKDSPLLERRPVNASPASVRLGGPYCGRLHDLSRLHSFEVRTPFTTKLNKDNGLQRASGDGAPLAATVPSVDLPSRRRQAQNTRETQREDAPASHSAAAQGPGERGKDGTVWEPVPPQSVRRGRQPSQNILRETAGPTLYARQAVTDKESALLCLLDARMLEHIRDCTVAQARLAGAHAWELSIGELKAFIALLYVRGAFSKNIEMESLWSGEWGLPFFQSTMPRSRYRDIMRHLRFDRREERMVRLSTDKFALATDVWQWFVANSIRCYRPSDNLTVDEQLFPTKARCRFTQYMANKRTNEARPPGQRLGESVVLKLVEPFMDKGRNVTVDNFFTSLSLANSLLRRNTSLVGTMNAARRELPPSAHQRAELFSSRVLKHDRTTLTIYQGKAKKNVCVLSSLHQTVAVESDRKKKPETVCFYNKSKCGVDTLDQMHGNIQQCTGTNIPRRAFILELAKELRRDVLRAKASSNAPELRLLPHPQVPGNRRQCQINRHCKKNRTTTICCGCQKPVCGKCVAKMESRCPACRSKQS
ncbi:hypothetical protein WMY93_021684 [Mugilogobius chulae]|uniref:PiggyBac transposable element-derived protein domain-containing protein n=1 Tax=Mugilogobius chulae TaxID=88201 RepID=A0AAW0NLH9_9GOBI